MKHTDKALRRRLKKTAKLAEAKKRETISTKEIKKILNQRLDGWMEEIRAIDKKEFDKVTEEELEQRMIADYRGHEIIEIAKALDIELY